MVPELPEPAADLDPILTRWRAGKRLYRVHPGTYGATEFNPGTGNPVRRGRFHPIQDVDGNAVPTLYAADRIAGALSETVFHNVVRGGEAIRRDRLKTQLLSSLELKQDVVLADLSGHGLRRLGLRRNQLLEAEAGAYAWTARWARALHACNPGIEGLLWVSRQFDTARAVMLFGDRVARSVLAVASAPVPLYRGAGFRQVQAAAMAAGILIIEG